MEVNKLTTAEIKEFIMNCVQDGSTYTVAQLKQYISRRTDKLYTRTDFRCAYAAYGNGQDSEQG